jgi:hypothetical protein
MGGVVGGTCATVARQAPVIRFPWPAWVMVTLLLKKLV